MHPGERSTSSLKPGRVRPPAMEAAAIEAPAQLLLLFLRRRQSLSTVVHPSAVTLVLSERSMSLTTVQLRSETGSMGEGQRMEFSKSSRCTY